MNYWKILRNFETEQEYIHFLEDLRWGDKRTCLRCESYKVWKLKVGPEGHRAQWVCSDCKCHYTVTVGTVFHGSKSEFKLWFEILYYTYGVDKKLSSWKIAKLTGAYLRTVQHIRNKIKNQSEGILLKKIFRLSE